MSTPAPKSDTPALGSPAWLRAKAHSVEAMASLHSKLTDTPIHKECADEIAGLRITAEALEKLERENAALRDSNIKALTSARNIARRAANVCSCDARRMGFVNEAKELDEAIDAARKQEGK